MNTIRTHFRISLALAALLLTIGLPALAPLWVAKTPLCCNWRHRAALEGDCVAREVTPGLDHDLDVLGLWDRNRPSEDRE